MTSVTHGGRAKRFNWRIQENQLFIETESGLAHQYSLDEVLEVIHSLHIRFGEDWFPLANNVEKMYSGTEQPGLGSGIYELRPGDTFHAQGASYLGVVLEEVGILEWNGEIRGICWRFRRTVQDVESISSLLTNQLT